MAENNGRLALHLEIERLLGELTPDDYTAPQIPAVPSMCVAVGNATERMKGLFTLFTRYEEIAAAGRLGRDEILKRGIHTALCYELGTHCDWGSHFGITTDWIVYRAKTGNAPREAVSTN
jgi:hypothetical protein